MKPETQRPISALRECRVILHVGLPKTGTSALQRALHDASGRLAQQAVLYDGLIASDGDPKHQWLVGALRGAAGGEALDFARFEPFRRIVLSCEGVSNEFDWFGRDAVANLASRFRKVGRLGIVLVDRQPLAWARSYYKQSIINPPSTRFSFYSTALPFADFVRLPEIAALMDRSALASRMEEAFAVPVATPRYEEHDMIGLARLLTGLPELEAAPARTRLNESAGDVSAEIMRQFNGMTRDVAKKNAWARLLVETLGETSAVLRIRAARSSADDFRQLDAGLLERIVFEENAPLDLRPELLAETVDRLGKALARKRLS